MKVGVGARCIVGMRVRDDGNRDLKVEKMVDGRTYL